MKFNQFALAAATLALASTAMAKTPIVNTSISEDEVIAAQKGWGDALVGISDAYAKGGQPAAKALAEKVIDSAYGYNLGPVLFKPTLTEAPQTFRTTRDGALSYFVGGNSSFSKDTGFALKGWKKVDIQNAAIFLAGDVATTMGNVTLTDKDGKVTTVDKTWQFKKDDSGKLRIVVHHSSLPYASK
ncbi:MAG: hypothetical protein RJB60_2871 [Pseudomonadota bacterium]|jgi:hypothetical protein